MTTEKYVNFTNAYLLKKLNFSWPGIFIFYYKEGTAKAPFYNTCYNEEGKEITPKLYNPNNAHYPRPTLMMALDWLETNHHFFIHVDLCKNEGEMMYSGVARNILKDSTLWSTIATCPTKHETLEKVLYNVLYILTAKL